MQGRLKKRVHGCVVVISFHTSTVVPLRPRPGKLKGKKLKTSKNIKNLSSSRGLLGKSWICSSAHTRVTPSYSPQGTKQEPHAILVLLNWPTTEYLILCHIPIAWVRIDQPIPSRVKDVTEQPKHRNMLDNNPKDAKNMNRFAHEIAQASSVDSCLGLSTPSTSIYHAWPTIGTLWHR